jgi:formate dehydrogenase iron-sulfur subunit
LTLRSSATVRAASIGWSRWSRSRPSGRVAYGPVKPSDLAGLLDADLLKAATHPLFAGLTEEIPFLKRQTRLTFARCGITDPLSLEDYKAMAG